MAEEIKKEEETLDSDAAAEEESQDTETDESELDEEDEDVEPDSEDDEDAEANDFHKTELEKIKGKLGRKVDKEREKRIAAERSKGLSREEAEKLVEERVAEVTRQLQRSSIEERAERLARTPEEKELILRHYDKSIVITGNVSEDIENAYALANKHRVRRTISELNQAVRSKETRGGGSDAGAEIKPKKTQKYSKEVVEAARRIGVTPEEFQKRLDEKK